MNDDTVGVIVKIDEAAVKQALERLGFLSADVPKKTFLSAARGAFRPFIDKARSMVPVRTGALKKSLGVKVKAYPSSKTIFAVAGARKGLEYAVGASGKIKRFAKGDIKPSRYIHLVEFGHRGRTKVTDGQLQDLYRVRNNIFDKRDRDTRRDILDYVHWTDTKNRLLSSGLTEKQTKRVKRQIESSVRKKYRKAFVYRKDGFTGGTGFMRKSFEATANQVLQEFISGVKKGIDKACQGQRPTDEGAAA